MSILKENATHIAKIEDLVINIYEKGLKLEKIDFPEVRLYRNVTEEFVETFFEMSDKNNSVNYCEYEEAYNEINN